MIFKKRQDVTLTDMAQWVDKNMLLQTYDEPLMVEYLYHLVITRAYQLSLCKDQETYDDFAIYCVTKILTRIKNTKEAPLKSAVNYIKTVISLWYSEYIRLFCGGYADIEVADFDLCDFSDYLVDVTATQDHNNYSLYCFKVSDVVHKYLKRIPRKKHDPEWSNICISCLLTLQDRLNLAGKMFKNSDSSENDLQLTRLIRSLKNHPPVLFHIDESMSNYILVLVNEIIHAISVELSDASSCKVLPSTCLKNLVIAANNVEDE